MVSMNDYYELLNEMNDRLTELHWLYSPELFLDSKVTTEKWNAILNDHKEYLLVLDRNIFSRLYNVLTTGETAEGSARDIAVLVQWAMMTNLHIHPYYALNEFAAGKGTEELARTEYNAFKQMFDKVSPLAWMALAKGYEEKLKETVTATSEYDETAFGENSIDYLAHYASLLHFAYLHRTEPDRIERFKKFFEWYYSSQKVSRFMELYIVLLLSGTEGYDFPKNMSSNSLQKVLEGCQNQARDISYLSQLSIDRYPSDEYEMILATDDQMMGNLFSEGFYNLHPIKMFEKKIKTHNRQVSEWVDDLLNNHTELCVDDYRKHCLDLIDVEERRLASLFQ